MRKHEKWNVFFFFFSFFLLFSFFSFRETRKSMSNVNKFFITTFLQSLTRLNQVDQQKTQNVKQPPSDLRLLINGTKYSRTDQVKFVEDSF